MSAVNDFRNKMVAAGLVFDTITDEPGIALATSTNVFAGMFPVSPNNAVRVATLPSPGPVRKMGSGVAGIVHYNVMVQVVVRAKGYSVANNMMAAIVTAMDNFVGTIGSTAYKHIVLVMGPFDLGHDENKRFQFSATFQMKGGSV